MVFVPRVCVDVMTAGLAPCVTSDPVTHAVTTTDNARMARVSAHKDGMADTVLCVSYDTRFQYCTLFVSCCTY